MLGPHLAWLRAPVKRDLEGRRQACTTGHQGRVRVHNGSETLARQPAGYTVGLCVEEHDRFIPCALVQLLGRFPALNVSGKKSVFVWFLSTAPDAALLSIADHPLGEDHLPKRLGRITLGVAVTHSLNKHRLGRTALYADKDGGEILLEWYERQGMSVLPASQRLPRSPRRLIKPSDGRYCYYTVEAALEASRELDDLR